MRLHELLLEYNQAALLNSFKDKFLARWEGEGKPYANEIGDDFLQWFEQFDPTQNKKYMSWLVRMYVNGGINKLEDLPARMGDVLDTYERLRRTNKLKPEHKDVNRIKSLPDFEDIVDLYSKDTASKKEQKKSAEQKFYDSGEAELIHNDKTWKIVETKSYEANCYFGVNTKWCTTKRNDASYFEEYSRRGRLFTILNKAANKRWQFQFESEEFKDERDVQINFGKFFFENPTVAKVFEQMDYLKFEQDSIAVVSWHNTTWYDEDGKVHREGGPARIGRDGHELWIVHGVRHREDGPAIINADGDKTWYVNGKIHRDGGPAEIDADGDKTWWKEGKIHREDGPAIESTSLKMWIQNGELHRDDGPAIINADGSEEWYVNGEKHREDGPAFIDADGTTEWYDTGTRTK